ncbi:MAG: transcriptional repressor [Verrucomicrobiales bacterium]|nr:transcriptional repressor [Verrucomicrobiales bacterium]
MKHTGCNHHRPDLGDLTDRLRRDARRITGPRQAILRVLQAHPRPMTNKEIFEALPSGECDLATVYRSLHLLEDMGLVERFDFGDGTARFEVARPGHSGHHHHLVCTACEAIHPIEDCLALEWEAKIARESGFRMVTHKLEFFGLCPGCQKKRPEPATPAKRVGSSRRPAARASSSGAKRKPRE